MRPTLAALWFALALWFFLGSSSSRSEVLGEIPRTPAVEAESLLPGTRAYLEDPPRVWIGGVQQRCSDCHALFSSLEVTPSAIRQHEHIALRHGMNDRCFNCHSREDRDRLILHDGSELGFSQSSQLCQKCHGTVFRDWEVGMHGRTLGSWIAGEGQERLRCVGCHDPHRPAFQPIEPLPGPHTWRRHPHPERGESEAGRANPLERWKHQ